MNASYFCFTVSFWTQAIFVLNEKATTLLLNVQIQITNYANKIKIWNSWLSFQQVASSKITQWGEPTSSLQVIILSNFQQKMNQSNTPIHLFKLIATILLIHTTLQLTNPLSFTPTTKHSYSGTSTFPTNSYYNTATSIINPLIYSMTFPNPMNDTSYKSGLTIQEIYADINTKSFNITFYLKAKNTGSLDVLIFSNLINKIKTMTIRYLIVASNWGSFYFYWFMESPGSISSSSPYSISRTSLDSVNMTGTVKVFSSLTGFDVTASSGINQLGLSLSITRSSATSISGTLTSLSATTITVGFISYNMLTYNVGEINAIPGRITLGTFSATNGGILNFVDSTSIVRTDNTLVGLKGFYIKNQAFLSWSATVTTNTSISVTSNNNFKSFQFIYIILQQNWCVQETPNLMVSTSICYDICPARYYGVNASLTCELCLYDCYECTNHNYCDSCNINTDFRQMNSLTKRCDAIAGYYDDGLSHAVALPCNANCATCKTLSTQCTSCLSNRILMSGVCKLCSDVVGTGCVACYQSGSNVLCSSCSNSNLKNGACVSTVRVLSTLNLADQPSKVGIWMILLPSFYGAFLGLYCCLILFCLWRRRKHKRNRVQEEKESEDNQSVDNRHMESIKVQNLSDSNIGSDSAEDSPTKFSQKKKKEPKITIKSNNRQNSLVIRQRQAENHYQDIENVRQLRIPRKVNKNQKISNKETQLNLSGESYMNVQTKRKILQKNKRNEQSESSVSSQQESKNNRRGSRRHQQNLIYYQQEEI